MAGFKFINGDGNYYDDKKFAEFDARVSRVLRCFDVHALDNKARTLYEVVPKTKEGNELCPIFVDNLNAIKFFENWHEITDASMSNKDHKLMVLRLQESVRNASIETQWICEKSGMVEIENEKMLVSGNKCFGNTDKQIILSEHLKAYQWRKDEDRVTLHSRTFSVMMDVSPNFSEIIAAAVLAAAMKPFFLEAGYPIEFCINVYGNSGTYKTSLVKALTDVIEVPEQLWGSFLNDSKRSLMNKIESGYGFVVLVDDYHPAARDYDMKKQTANMDAVARLMGNNYRTAFVIMTSEFLDGCYSLQDRMLQLEVQKVDLELLTELQNMNYLVSQLVQDFLGALIDNYSEVIITIREAFKEAGTMNDVISTRIERNGTFLKIAVRLFSHFLLNDEIEPLKRLEDALTNQGRIQKGHMDALKKYESADDAVIQIYEMIVGGMFDMCTAREKYQCKNDQIFIKSEGICYMTKNAIKFGLKKYYGVQNVNVGKLVKSLQENDILLEDKDTITRKFMGIRHLCISYRALSQYVAAECGEVEGNYARIFDIT